MIAESLLLAFLGGVAGLVTGAGLVRILVEYLPDTLPRRDGITLDLTVVLFTFARFFWWRGRRGPWAAYGGPAPDPRAILAERYARGEITLEEYRERLGNLQP